MRLNSAVGLKLVKSPLMRKIIAEAIILSTLIQRAIIRGSLMFMG